MTRRQESTARQSWVRKRRPDLCHGYWENLVLYRCLQINETSAIWIEKMYFIGWTCWRVWNLGSWEIHFLYLLWMTALLQYIVTGRGYFYLHDKPTVAWNVSSHFITIALVLFPSVLMDVRKRLSCWRICKCNFAFSAMVHRHLGDSRELYMIWTRFQKPYLTSPRTSSKSNRLIHYSSRVLCNWHSEVWHLEWAPSAYTSVSELRMQKGVLKNVALLPSVHCPAIVRTSALDPPVVDNAENAEVHVHLSNSRYQWQPVFQVVRQTSSDLTTMAATELHTVPYYGKKNTVILTLIILISKWASPHFVVIIAGDFLTHHYRGAKDIVSCLIFRNDMLSTYILWDDVLWTFHFCTSPSCRGAVTLCEVSSPCLGMGTAHYQRKITLQSHWECCGSSYNMILFLSLIAHYEFKSRCFPSTQHNWLTLPS